MTVTSNKLIELPLLPAEDGVLRSVWARRDAIVRIIKVQGDGGCGVVLGDWPQTHEHPLGVDLAPDAIAHWVNGA